MCWFSVFAQVSLFNVLKEQIKATITVKAKKIAKDLEKWEKKLEKTKEKTQEIKKVFFFNF